MLYHQHASSDYSEHIRGVHPTSEFDSSTTNSVHHNTHHVHVTCVELHHASDNLGNDHLDLRDSITSFDPDLDPDRDNHSSSEYFDYPWTYNDSVRSNRDSNIHLGSVYDIPHHIHDHTTGEYRNIHQHLDVRSESINHHAKHHDYIHRSWNNKHDCQVCSPKSRGPSDVEKSPEESSESKFS